MRTRISVEKSNLLQTNWLPPQVACVEAEVCVRSGQPRFIHDFPTHNTAAATQTKEANGKGFLPRVKIYGHGGVHEERGNTGRSVSFEIKGSVHTKNIKIYQFSHLLPLSSHTMERNTREMSSFNCGAHSIGQLHFRNTDFSL